MSSNGTAPKETAVNTMLDLALQYAASGFAVFPLAWREKKPMGGSNGCLDATTDEAQVRTWWTKYPRNNIGIATGAESGVWVLDVDGDPGYASLMDLVKRHGTLPRTVTANTGSGGKHYYYKHPGWRVSNSRRRLPGLDSRGDGGYVVAPGSIHPNGNAYEWAKGCAPGDVEIAAAPRWLLDELAPNRDVIRPVDPDTGEADDFVLAGDQLDDVCEQLMRRAVINAAENQERHPSCQWLAKQLQDHRVPIEHAESAILRYQKYLEIVPWNPSRRFTETEALKVLGHVYSHFTPREPFMVQAAPAEGEPKASTDTPVAEMFAPAAGEETAGPPRLRMWSLSDLFAWQAPDDDNLLGDRVISAGELTLLVGPPDIGKSRTAIQLIFDFLLGNEKWMGVLPLGMHDLKIMFVQTENKHRRLLRDFSAQLAGVPEYRRQAINDRFCFYIPEKPEDSDLSLANLDAVVRFRNTVEAFRPDLCVLDPYGDFFAGDNENDAVQARNTVKMILKVCQAASQKTAILLIHHARSGKAAAAGADGWDRQAYARGSKALMSIARAQINIAPGDAEGKSLVIACGKNNNGPKFERFAVRLDQETMRYEPDPEFDWSEWEEEVTMADNRKSKAKISNDMLRMVLGTASLPHAQLVQLLMDAADCRKTTAYSAIKKAAREGLILIAANHVKWTGD